jgi:hypothetical protein
VGCISPYQPRLPGRRIGSKVSADITCREIQGAETGDLQVCEILAHAPTFLKDFFGRCPDVGHFRIEAKVLMNARAQKRGGLFEITSLDTKAKENTVDHPELVRISETLEELAKVEPALAEIVDLPKAFVSQSALTGSRDCSGFGSDTEENLITLCAACHAIAHDR